MRGKYLQLLLVIVCLSNWITGFSQGTSEMPVSGRAVIDSLKKNGVIFRENQKDPQISLTKEQAVRFLQQRTQSQFWNDSRDPFRLALSHLIYEASHPKFDSIENFLKQYPYDSLLVPWDKFYIWEPLRLKIPVISAPDFPLEPNPVIRADTNLFKADDDSVTLKRLSLPDHPVQRPIAGLKDTTILVVIDTLREVASSASGFPFRYYNFPYQGDSIGIAVKSLLKYLEQRDSTVIKFSGVGKEVIPVWLNSKERVMMRYWLKNEFSDSVTVWIGNPSRNTIGLYLEQGVNFRRPVKQANYSEARINVQRLDNSKLHKVQKIYVKPNYWKYRTESSLVLSQTALSNWVKGGENSIATALDVTGYADYSNKQLKLSSNNFVRLKLGFLQSGSEPVKKNIDLLETNSKLNHKAFGKFDFSAILLFKTQIAIGKNYLKTPAGEDSSVIVSKFMSPAILTVGIGLDYKPNKTTSINFSPLSYKGTFVMDAAYNGPYIPDFNIDQTKYGIAKNKRALNEAGVSFVISNEFRPFKNVAVTNRLQLFSNYIKKPQNIDVDWEMIAVTNLNWFTDVRLNTHLIFDDDTKTVVKGKDGSEKKTARSQFKEMLGLSFVFRF